MKNTSETDAVSETVGYLLTVVGFVLVIAFFALSNIVMASRVLASVGLRFVAENTGLILLAGIVAVAAGALIIVTSGVDVEEG